MAVTISKFASDPNLLNTPLWPKQAEILEEFWRENYAIAVWALGRRSGKSLMSSVVATFAACTLADEYKKYLRQNEKFYIISVANSDSQAKIALQGVKDLINGSPILKHLIIRETSDTLEMSNGAVFRSLPASSRSGRGMACPLVIFDELAHAVDSEGNAAGSSLYQALSPSTAQFGNLGKILLLSSPWIQSGIFWDLFNQGSSGNFAHMQVVQAPSWDVNPTLSKQFLEQEKARDPTIFEVEYGASFSQSLASFIDSNLIEGAIDREYESFSPKNRYKGEYYLSLDPAKGSRDLYVACIGHYEDKVFVIDLFYEFKPSYDDGGKKQISISEVENFIEIWHSRYQFRQVVLDQFNSQSTIQRLSNLMPIKELTWTSKSKTQAFTRLRELFVGGNISLYRHEKALAQLKNLIVTYRSGGSWSVSGGAGAAVDDYCMALAGAVLAAGDKPPYDHSWLNNL